MDSYKRVRGISALLLLCGLPVFGATLTVTNVNDSGPGSLRQAMLNAVSGDTIDFASSANGVIVLQSALPPIGVNVTINGPGVANLAITGRYQAFSMAGAAAVTITGLSIDNCSAGIGSSGAAIVNFSAAVTVTNVNLFGNSAPDGGGAIANYAVMSLTNVNLAGNSSASAGGAILNLGAMTLTNVTLSGNSAYFGGAILNDGPMTVTNSTLAGNSASNTGGAIYNISVLSLFNDTLYGNSAPAAGGIFNIRVASMQGTILAHGNTGENCFNTGTLGSLGYNLSDDTTCTSILVATGDLNDRPAGLSPAGLQNNGGPTLTIALLPTSPAVNHIPTGSCTVTTDERGVARPQDGACDIGAFELAEFSAFTAKLIVFPTSEGTFDLSANFTTGSTADVINPPTQVVSLQVGPYSVTLPAGSFRAAGPGTWTFSGIVGFTDLGIQIASLGNGRYQFTATGVGFNFSHLTSPTTVSITIDVNSGTITVPFT